MKRILLQAFASSSPILLPYGCIGLLYGFLFEQSSYPIYLAFISSLFTYAGVIQLLVLKLVSLDVPLMAILLTILPVSFRSTFYVLALAKRLRAYPLLVRIFISCTLVDATFSILSTDTKQHTDKEKMWYRVGVAAMIYFYWNSSTLLGVFFGSYLSNNLPGMNALLFLLFVIFSLEHYLNTKDFAGYTIGGASLLIALYAPQDYFLLVGFSLAALGAAFLPVKYYKEKVA